MKFWSEFLKCLFGDFQFMQLQMIAEIFNKTLTILTKIC